jgi:hypothetical protein
MNLPDAMRMLDAQAYRAPIRARLGAKADKLAQAAAVLGHARCFVFTRPRGFEAMGESAAAIAAHWAALAR